jgi:hypothetical protein
MTSGATAFVYVVLRIAAAVGAGAVLGWFAGSTWLGISGSLGPYLAWNLWQLRTLHFWIQHRSIADPPDAMGLWGDVVAQVVRLHRRKRFHKERLTRLFQNILEMARIDTGTIATEARWAHPSEIIAAAR